MGAFLCKHSIISCASKSRAKNVKKVLLPEKPTTSSRNKTWQPKEVTSAQAMTVVISHQACDQGWKIPPKCRRNTREEFHQAYPAFCPLSGDSGPSMEYITFSDNALPSLRPYRVFSRPEPMSSCPQHQGGNRLGRRMIQHCLSPGSSSLPSHACSQQYSLPALRMRQEVCALLTQGQSRCPTVTTAPSS